MRLRSASIGSGLPALWERRPGEKLAEVIIWGVTGDSVLIRLPDLEVRTVPEKSLRWPSMPQVIHNVNRRDIAGYQVNRSHGYWHIWDGSRMVSERADLREVFEWIGPRRLDIERVQVPAVTG